MQYTESLVPHLNATLTLPWESQVAQETSVYTEENLDYWSKRYKGRDLKQIMQAKLEILSWAERDPNLNFSFERLCRIQEILLGKEVRFRKSEAFCRNRKYTYFDSLEDMFKRKLSQDSKDICHPLARGLRLYLDIIHFHPFEDGNSRAAYLWFNYVMALAGQDVPSFGKIGLLTTLPITVENYKLLLEFCKKQQSSRTRSESEVTI